MVWVIEVVQPRRKRKVAPVGSGELSRYRACLRGFLKPFLKPFPAACPKTRPCGWVGAVLGEGGLGAVAFQHPAPASRCHQSARRQSPASGHVLLSLASVGEAEKKRGQIQVKAGNPVSKSNVSSFFFFFLLLPPF